MARRITFYFEQGSILSLIDTDEELPVGTWKAPYPNTVEDSAVFGLLEAYGQSPESPVYALAVEYGEPLEVIIADYNPETGDGSRVISGTEVSILSNPEALAALREDPDAQAARSGPRPERRRGPWERQGHISEP